MTQGEFNELSHQEQEAARRRHKGLWRLEVVWEQAKTAPNTPAGIFTETFPNLFSWEMRDLREKFFSVGMAVRVDPSRYKIVMPQQFREITVERQRYFITVEDFVNSK